MDGIGIWHLIILFTVLLLLVFGYFWPLVRILQKAGYSGWWVLIALIPFGGVIGLWVFAASDWPALKRSS
jgi:uncharacterized membrane protein YhaH (DUF805 family)